MSHSRNAFFLLAVLGASACGRETPRTDVASDSGRVADSVVPIVDAPRPDTSKLPAAAVPTKPAASKPKAVNAPPPPPAAASVPPAAAAPQPAAGRTLASGTHISTTAIDSIHSHLNKPGDRVRVKVGADVADANGRVVIPAGSVVTLSIVEIAKAANRGEKGVLVMSAQSIEIGGSSHPLNASVSDYEYEMKAVPVGGSEVAKTGAGVAVGAVVGRVIGGKTGTVVGAVGGGAAGAAIAAKTADRDIIVHAGGGVTLSLSAPFTIMN